MGSYLPATEPERQTMLSGLGLNGPEDLFDCVPKAVRLSAPPEGLPGPRSELEVRRLMEGLAAKNTVFPTILRGAGAYRHYIPAAVSAIAAKEEFVTAYTPYQAEISQGVLQSIFEFQTMICELTGLDAANASVYDGASAAAEAVAMCRDRKRGRVYLSAAVHPDVIATVRTYCFGSGAELEILPVRDGVTDLEALRAALGADAACVLIQQPNFFGALEPCGEIADIVHAAGAKLIMSVNPAALGVLKSPGACGADIAVGEGQPLGIPLSWGGPYLGFMAAAAPLMRKLPGRIVGETTDAKGERAFVLTMQAREQHIRREKASSNVCSNQALCALTASVYLTLMGPEGLRRWASSPTLRPTTWRTSCARPRRRAACTTGHSSTNLSPPCPSRPGPLRAGEKGILGGLPCEERRAVVRHRVLHQGRPGRGCGHHQGGVRKMKLIFEMSRPGRGNKVLTPYQTTLNLNPPRRSPPSEIPAAFRRSVAPRLPEVERERPLPPL